MNHTTSLRPLADAASRQAYAPYSRLHVGAALRSASGATYSGCNVENGSLSIGLCAERAAIAAAVLAEGPAFRLSAIAISAFNSHGRAMPVPPCGACRQALQEFAGDATVGFLGGDGSWTEVGVESLLPHGFVLPEDL
ncbi:MAG: cytidine deaminase [Xanthomonadales bacterium]|nr:cytidine deaminase [Xanthomonadales bacterium]